MENREPFVATEGEDPTVAMLTCELHDGPCQQLAAASSHLEAFRHLFPTDAEGAWKEYEVGMSRLRRGISELRALLSGLRVTHLDGRPLLTAIEGLARQFTAEHGIRVKVFCRPEQLDVPPALETTVFRIVQEGLANVRRHSRSELAHVRIARNEGTVRVDIEDWGAGFDPAGVPASCVGLAVIRSRAESAGGDLIVTSQRGAGTLIAVSLPC
jgi:signal transduction histidine kinase